MCEYCERGKALKNDQEAFVLLGESVFDGDVVVMQVIEAWRGLFGKPRYHHVLIDVPVRYCPMCGRKLGGGE